MSLPPDPRAAANLLLIEIGNSHITSATAAGDQPADAKRMDVDAGEDVLRALDAAWASLPAGRARAVVMASVVPKATARLRAALHERLGGEPVVLGEQIGVPIDVKIERPESVGIDRLCAAAAAYDRIQAACAIASFGTAITIDCVDDEGSFRGGAILPGLDLQARSLHGGTAQLPEVEIRAPQNVYGQNTSDAIVNGVVLGAAGALREIVERYATDLGRWPHLVVTGGRAALLRESCDFIDSVAPDLVLRGMVLSYRAFYAGER